MIITCPECHKELDSEKVNFRAHALNHWGVEERHLDRIRNTEAVKRYKIILEAAEKADAEKDMLNNKMADMQQHVKTMQEDAE